MTGRARGLAAIGLAAGLAYVLYPVGYRVQGVGVLPPSVESLVPVPAPISGIVSRVDVRPPSAVTPGLALPAVVPMREAGVLTEATMTRPGGVMGPAAEPPAEIRTALRPRFSPAPLRDPPPRCISRCAASQLVEGGDVLGHPTSR